jgi:phosphomannomutase
VLNPIELRAVVAGRHVHGHHPDEIHPGVAWWTGACLIKVQKVHGVALVHDGRELSQVFADRFARGAINCEHYAATVSDLGVGDLALLHFAIRTLQVPGVHITTTDTDEVALDLFDANANPIDENRGLARIRALMQADRVPIPVNAQARGRILHRHDLAKHFAEAEG